MKSRLIIASVILFSTLVSAGTKKAADSRKIPNKQYVAIYFEKFDAKAGVVLLELRNETAWPIRIPIELKPELLRAGIAKDRQELPVRYYIEPFDPMPAMQLTMNGKKEPPDEPQHPPTPKVARYDFHTEILVPVGKSILFRVPKEHLARNCKLTVNLRYEWESLTTEDLTGPVHYVEFRGVELPEEVQKEIP